MRRASLSIIVSLLTLAISSCQKEVSDFGEPVDNSCKVVKSYIYDTNNNLDDSIFYTYENDQLVRATFTDGAYDLEYNGDFVVRRNTYDSPSDTTISLYETFEYYTDGSIKNIELYYPFNGVDFQVAATYEFTYMNGQLSRLGILVDDYGDGSSYTYHQFDYSYIGQNISKCESAYDNGSYYDTAYYSYDSNPNYITAQNSYAFYTDYLFYDFDPVMAPFVFSANNVTTIEAYNLTMPVTYTRDAESNLTGISLNNILLTSYEYDCP